MTGRVAVIGAGSSGIVAVKSLLEAGFADIVCFERRDVIGGLWYFKDEKDTWSDESSVNRSTIIISSKELLSFSDFPLPDHYPNFCHHTEMLAYFVDYCKHFGVDKYIKYNMEVVTLRKHSSYNSTGQWEVRTKDHSSGQEETQVFDFVIVATGHHGEPNMPTFPGQDKFQGVVMHSKEFKDLCRVNGTRALVVGIGNSGGECCVEVSKYMKVFVSTRRGFWIFSRLTTNGLPWDYYYHTRFYSYLRSWIPRSYRNKKLKDQLNERCDHDFYHIRPANEPDETHPTINDELPNRIAAGRIVIKPDVRNFTENGVVFEDGSFENNLDLVICATGYKINLPFIDKDVLDIRNNKVDMYKRIFLPDLPKQTLAFVGFAQPLGATFPVLEIQSRVVAQVFQGAVKLPSAEVMKADIRRYLDPQNKAFVQTTDRHTIQLYWLPYMDEMATLIGCKPNLFKLLLTDPVLFYHVAFGPCVTYQYRLRGPNTWSGARQAILTTMDRIKKPFETRTTPKPKNDKNSSWVTYLLVTCAGVAGLGLAAQYVRQNEMDLSKYMPANFKL